MKQYFYLDSNNTQHGPVSADVLIASGVGLNTLVWTEGMKDWAPASAVAEISVLLQGRAPSQRDYSDHYQKQEHTYAPPQQPASQPSYPPQQPAYQAPQQQPAYQPQPQPAVYGGMPQQQASNAYAGQGPLQNGAQPPFPKPDNNLVWGILCTVLCCLPFGIISIVKASQVDRKYNSGDYYGALEAAKSAKSWAIWGAVLGFIISIVYSIISFASSAAAIGSSSFY